MSDELEVALDLNGETVTAAGSSKAFPMPSRTVPSEVRRFESAFEDLREQMVSRCTPTASQAPRGNRSVGRRRGRSTAASNDTSFKTQERGEALGVELD